MLRGWTPARRFPLAFGALAGGLWGFLTAAGATPHARLAYDANRQLVHIYRGQQAGPLAVSAEAFSQIYMINLIQVAVTFFLLCLTAGWVAWQLSRTRPRGQPQLPLWEGGSVLALAFFWSGLGAVLLFQWAHLGEWFNRQQLTPASLVTGLIALLLPLFDGIGVFLVWFLRLDSVRAPDWETHIPPPRSLMWPLIHRLVQRIRSVRKGGRDAIT